MTINHPAQEEIVHKSVVSGATKLAEAKAVWSVGVLECCKDFKLSAHFDILISITPVLLYSTASALAERL